MKVEDPHRWDPFLWRMYVYVVGHDVYLHTVGVVKRFQDSGLRWAVTAGWWAVSAGVYSPVMCSPLHGSQLYVHRGWRRNKSSVEQGWRPGGRTHLLLPQKESSWQAPLLQYYSMPPSTNQVPLSGVRGGVVWGTRREGLLYHKKVSVEEHSPVFSGLMSTLTQATFSRLLHREETETDGREMSVSAT